MVGMVVAVGAVVAAVVASEVHAWVWGWEVSHGEEVSW
jgi:hypothetical protein